MARFTWDFAPYKFADYILDDAERLQRGIAITILNNLQLLSPVDEGRYRANHILSFGSPDYSYSDTNGGISAAMSALNRRPRGQLQTVFIQNNLPYASVIENGEYPNPVKKGTYNKRTKRYEIRSINGYSKQAPQGVYGLAYEAAVAAYT